MNEDREEVEGSNEVIFIPKEKKYCKSWKAQRNEYNKQLSEIRKLEVKIILSISIQLWVSFLSALPPPLLSFLDF